MLSWFELLCESVKGLKISEEKLLTWHIAATTKMFHANSQVPPPPGAVVDMYYALSFPSLSRICELDPTECEFLILFLILLSIFFFMFNSFILVEYIY